MALPFTFNSTAVGFSSWLLVVVLGMGWVYRYENTPQTSAQAPPQWPSDSQITLVENRSTLLLFVHPRCPCTNATFDELERLLARSPEKMRTYVIFTHPKNAPPDWHRTKLWSRAEIISGVLVIDDLNCTETRRFGVATSGQSLLYDPGGKLLFAGGITASRGHAGENVGTDAIQSILADYSTAANKSPNCCSVFGCPLFESDESDARVQNQ